MKKKTCLLLTLCTMLTASLTACGGQNPQTGTPASGTEVSQQQSDEKNTGKNTSVLPKIKDPGVFDLEDKSGWEYVNAETEIYPVSSANAADGFLNGRYFATPIVNGTPWDVTAMSEFRISAADANDCGISINPAALKKDYVMLECWDGSIYITDQTPGTADSYESLSLYIVSEERYNSLYESRYSNREELPSSGDTAFYYGHMYCELSAVTKIDNYYFIIDSGTKEARDDAEIQSLQADMLDLIANASFINNSPNFTSLYDLCDTIAFDCGWKVTDIFNVVTCYQFVGFNYESDEDSTILSIMVSRLSADEMKKHIDDSYENAIIRFIDKAGNDVGYIDIHQSNSTSMVYFIRCSDGTYMEVEISDLTLFGSDSFDVHKWSDVENLLTNGL